MSIDDAPKPYQVINIFEKIYNYRLLPATGAIGGATPTGEIIVDFFVERHSIPDKIIYEIGPSEKKEIKREGQRVIREIQVGIILRPEHAHLIGTWLIEKAIKAGFTGE
jgi:hypothetical protein